jgi:hypothetical protein
MKRDIAKSKTGFMFPFLCLWALAPLCPPTCLWGANHGSLSGTTPVLVAAQQGTPVGTSDKVDPPQLSGTVVDTSGAVIAAATVQVRSANGVVQRKTRSDTSGSFIISGLASGNYRLVVSDPGFETKEIPVTLGTTKAPGPLRIVLLVGSLSTAVSG